MRLHPSNTETLRLINTQNQKQKEKDFLSSGTLHELFHIKACRSSSEVERARACFSRLVVAVEVDMVMVVDRALSQHLVQEHEAERIGGGTRRMGSRYWMVIHAWWNGRERKQRRWMGMGVRMRMRMRVWVLMWMLVLMRMRMPMSMKRRRAAEIEEGQECTSALVIGWVMEVATILPMLALQQPVIVPVMRCQAEPAPFVTANAFIPLVNLKSEECSTGTKLTCYMIASCVLMNGSFAPGARLCCLLYPLRGSLLTLSQPTGPMVVLLTSLMFVPRYIMMHTHATLTRIALGFRATSRINLASIAARVETPLEFRDAAHCRPRG